MNDEQMARATQALFDAASASVSKFFSIKTGAVPEAADMRLRVDKVLKQYLLSHEHDDVVEEWEKTGKWPHERNL
jgi:mannose/cellobiose epimerase-like protein (N-acyl-D-glucosamine 2-epimerase family)|tara:strand:+ start:1072 stop:1296 length:225 start_codon:yes stop_codon:yes gene_type:complete